MVPVFFIKKSDQHLKGTSNRNKNYNKKTKLIGCFVPPLELCWAAPEILRCLISGKSNYFREKVIK